MEGQPVIELHDVLRLEGPRLLVGGPRGGDLVEVPQCLNTLEIGSQVEPSTYLRCVVRTQLNSIIPIFVHESVFGAEKKAEFWAAVQQTRFRVFLAG